MTNQDEYHKWILFSENEIENLCNEIQGKNYDRETNSYRQFREALMNDNGVAGMKVYLKSVLSPNTFLSNLLDEEDMKKTGWQICSGILGTLTLHSEEWGLKPRSKQFIMGLIMNYVDFALRRALKQGEREFAKNTMTTHRSVVDRNSKPYDVVYMDENQQTQQY